MKKTLKFALCGAIAGPIVAFFRLHMSAAESTMGQIGQLLLSLIITAAMLGLVGYVADLRER
jgi:hypothetical protein